MSKQNQKRRQRLAKSNTTPAVVPAVKNGHGRPISTDIQRMLDEIADRKGFIRETLRARRASGYRSRSERGLDVERNAAIRVESATIRALRAKVADARPWREPSEQRA